MQTSFTLAQLADPDIAEAERILRTCVRCGFCTATCPTYVLLGNELDSPRGRIYLIKDLLESGGNATSDVVKHVDRCLSCLACMTTCPSGVHYMHLVDHARAYIEATYRRPRVERLFRALIASILPHNRRLRFALATARIGKPFATLFSRLGLGPVAAMLRLAPDRLPARGERRRQFQPLARSRGRVGLLTGCVSPVINPSINAAAVRLLTRCGIEVVVADEGCCGALVHHLGREREARDTARRQIDAWTGEIEGKGLDAIIVTASGCGTTVKDYGFMLRTDKAYAEKASRVSRLALDISEYLDRLPLAPGSEHQGVVVAYHAACSLAHGQKISRAPKELLSKLGFVVKDIAEGHLCCGSAGTYNILQSELAGRLRERKVANIEKVKPDVIAAGNIGCITQIAAGTAIPVVHTVELIDWATGGRKPEALAERKLAAGAGRRGDERVEVLNGNESEPQPIGRH
jgi:glycolate oxidase iron-sulfur subunit